MNQDLLFFCESKINAHYDRLRTLGWTVDLSDRLARRIKMMGNPNCRRFFAAIQPLLLVDGAAFNGSGEVVQIGDDRSGANADIHGALTALIPWRKGPYRVFGIEIDAEWRSNKKWDRIAHLTPHFINKRVLDVGCNSGYYLFRLVSFGPRIVVGVDPSDLFFFQFHALTHGVSELPISYLPLRLDELGEGKAWFDTVLCMGILYHQRSPIEALRGLRLHLKPQGVLILETIIIDDPGDFSVTPVDTYAKMANVYYIPTLRCLLTWIRRAGFREATVLDVSKTEADEQRRTPWVNTESLSDFLDPSDLNRTIEGYPAPSRAVILCRIRGS